MSKLQTIFILFIFLIALFLIDSIFGNPLRETFSNPSLNVEELINTPIKKINSLNSNMMYSGSGFLGDNGYYPKGDDQPLFFGFSM